MNLHLPELMHGLDRKPIMMAYAMSPPREVDRKDRERAALVGRLLPQMHKAQKFIFDSGQDRDEETTSAIRDTALNMLEAGFFHMPFPLCWIEDPFDDDPTTTTRNFYLVTEDEKTIRVRLIQRFRGMQQDDLEPEERVNLSDGPTTILHKEEAIIDLENPSDAFTVPGGAIPELVRYSLGEAVYAVKKFVVTLATEQAETERVKRNGTRGASSDKRTRSYDYSVVRIPLDHPERGERGSGSGGRARRRALVRGYMWGKFTRPLDQQRWIKPFWRGSKDAGERDPASRFYVVGSA